MSRRVRWTTRAATQLEAAALYLEESRPHTGLRFVESVESILLLAIAAVRGLFVTG